LWGWLCLYGAAQAQSHFTVGADYLEWWLGARNVPRLLNRGDVDDTIPGANGQPGTRPVIGPGDLGPPASCGVRLHFDCGAPDQDCALGGSIFAVFQNPFIRRAGGQGDDPNLVL